MGNPGVTTLLAIRTAARQRADMVNSQFLTDTEFNSNVNASYQELFDLLVQKYGNDYYVALDSTKKPYQFTTDGTNEFFALPDGSSTYKMPDATTNAPAFYKGIGVDLQLSGANDWVTLKPFPMIERNKFAVPNMQAVRGRRTNLGYRFSGNMQGNSPVQYLWLRPLPMSGQIIQVWYIPRLTALASDTDSVDAVSGWEEYIVVDAAIKALQKEESDCTLLMAQKQELIKRIEAAAENRDAGSPMRVGDARRSNGYGMYGESSGFGEEWP